MRGLGVVLLAAFMSFAAPAAGQDTLAPTAAQELRAMCEADRARLWGVDLCGPLIVADPGNRMAWASQPDQAGVFRSYGVGYYGTLPAGVPIANATVNWDGVQWIMVMAPLPQDAIERRVLIAHEAWHRAQNSLNLAARNVDAPHLETERGRILMRLELRALSTAMRSRAQARRRAARDAAYLRNMRIAEFLNAGYAEMALDRNEGLASYTGVRLGIPDSAQADQFVARTLDNYDRSDALARSYAYASGPAYGLLLDEIRATWRGELGERSPADFLSALLRPGRYDPDEFVRLSARYGGPQVVAEERVRADEHRVLMADVQARFARGPRLVLNARNMRMEFDPNAVTPVEGLGSFYATLTVRDVWGELRATQGALISSDFTRIVVANPGPDGLSGPGWTLTATPGAYVLPPDATGARTIAAMQ